MFEYTRGEQIEEVCIILPNKVTVNKEVGRDNCRLIYSTSEYLAVSYNDGYVDRYPLAYVARVRIGDRYS